MINKKIVSVKDRISSSFIYIQEKALADLSGDINNFYEQIDALVDESFFLKEEDLMILHSKLGIEHSFEKMKNDAKLTAELSFSFLDSLKEKKESQYKNFYIFRDAFSLYMAEKIKHQDSEPNPIYLSKAMFQRIGGDILLISQLFMDTVYYNLRTELNTKFSMNEFFEYCMQKYRDSDEFQKFKEGFKTIFKDRLTVNKNLAKATDYFKKYFDEINILETISKNPIRFVDTTEKGSFVLFLETVLSVYLEEKGFSREEVENKVTGNMFYSYTFQAFSFLKDSFEDNSILVRNKWRRTTEIPNYIKYPVDFDGRGFIKKMDETGFSFPIMKNSDGDNTSFIYYLVLLKHEMNKLVD